MQGARVSSQCCGADFPVCRLDRLESLPHTPLPQLIEKVRARQLSAYPNASCHSERSEESLGCKPRFFGSASE